MNFDQLVKIEKNYQEWLRKQSHFESTKIEVNENGKWALRINYRKGMPHSVKKEIASELGDVQLKWVMIDAEKQK
jgi:hypothetical protein